MYFFMHMQIINGVLTGMNAGTAVLLHHKHTHTRARLHAREYKSEPQ